MKPTNPITDQELSILINEIATERGLRIPQTAEEVRIFENIFSTEINAAKQPKQDLKSILSLAQKLNDSDAPIFCPIEEVKPDEKYQIAARNGKIISKETEAKMDKALKKIQEKSNNERR